MTDTSASATGQVLRRALAEARSARVPAGADLVADRPLPWPGESFPVRRPDGAGGAGRYGVPGQPPPDGELVDLDRLLRLSLAVPDGGTGRRRPVASAGALHPVRLHLLLGAGCSLPPGRYAYDPGAHRAHRRGPAPADAPSGAVAVLAVAAGNTAAHYAHRAWPLLLLDTGHAAAALVLAADTPGPRLCLDADSATLAAAAGLPRPDDWTTTWPGTDPEHPLAAVHFTPGPTHRTADPLSAWAALPLADAPSPGAGGTPPAVLAQTRRLLEIVGDAGQASPTWHTVGRPAPVTDAALSTRRSADPADLTRPVPEDLLAQVLTTAATAWPGGPSWSAAVGGPTPALLTPTGGAEPTLGLLASGEARPTLARWAAGQQWIAETGAVLLAHGCPSDAPVARIRRDQLAAGYAAGLAHAHATAAGLPARPVGSWQQADLGAALGDAPGHDWVVHGLALGGPPDPNPAPHEEERT